MVNKKEQWKIHSDFPYLEISDQGRVRNKITKKIKEIKKPRNTNYLLLKRKVEGKTKTKPLHRLVAELFIGPIPDDMTVDHINGNPRDNRVINLEIVSAKENTVRQIRLWSHPHSFYDRNLIQAHSEKRWVYNDKLYNWIELLKILYNKNIRYYQVKWRNSENGRVGVLPNGETITRLKKIVDEEDLF